MSAPRHLWSGDWRAESESAADQLRRRRADTDPAAGGPPERGAGEARASRLRTARERLRQLGAALVARMRALQPRTALRALLLVALIAGAAFAAMTVLGGIGHEPGLGGRER